MGEKPPQPNFEGNPENLEARERLSAWLEGHDMSLAILAYQMKQERPDKQAPAKAQVEFMSKFAALTGKRELLWDLIKQINEE